MSFQIDVSDWNKTLEAYYLTQKIIWGRLFFFQVPLAPIHKSYYERSAKWCRK